VKQRTQRLCLDAQKICLDRRSQRAEPYPRPPLELPAEGKRKGSRQNHRVPVSRAGAAQDEPFDGLKAGENKSLGIGRLGLGRSGGFAGGKRLLTMAVVLFLQGDEDFH
jgi:hypothetical protein